MQPGKITPPTLRQARTPDRQALAASAAMLARRLDADRGCNLRIGPSAAGARPEVFLYQKHPDCALDIDHVAARRKTIRNNLPEGVLTLPEAIAKVLPPLRRNPLP
jgi:hypothetical protein